MPASGNNEMRFLNILLAFQCFGGKPLKSLEAGNALSEDALLTLELCLHQLADRLREEDEEKWEELHKLAAQIETALGWMGGK